MGGSPKYRDTLKYCCLLSIKWMTIIYAVVMVVTLMLPAAYRDKSTVGIWGMIGNAAGLLVLLWLWGLVAAVFVSPLAHSLALRRAGRLQASDETERLSQTFD